jgi:CubicO group peptidase (beta-lactamase class C family)
MIIKLVKTIVFFLFITEGTFAQSSLESKVDNYVMQQMGKSFTPGVAVGIVRDGKVLLAKGYGLANVELAVFTDANSVFQLLSITKQFTAAAIMMLVQSGKLTLDEPVHKYLPDVPASWNSITIRNLLTHTSGIVDLTDVHPFFEQIREDATPWQLLTPVYKLDLVFKPGSQWRYSNSNYFILGMVIEKISGKSYIDFLQENIFIPLGMKSTKVNDLTDVIPYRVSGYHWLGENAEQEPSMISGYHGIKNVLQNAIYISPTREWAAGGIVSSINDLIKWDSALNNHILLNKASDEQMTNPAKLISGTEVNYGFGNELFTMRNHRVAGHQGGGMAFNTTYLRFINDNVSVIVFCNQTTGPSKQIASHIASFIIPGLEYDSLTQTVPGSESKDITEIFKTIISMARNGEVDKKLFADEAQETANFIQRAGADFFKQQGDLQSIQFLEDKQEGAKHIYIYRTRFKNSIVLWNIEFNKQKKVLAIIPKPE